MRDKYIRFIKNAGIGAAISIPSGIAGSWIADLFTDSSATIAMTSTLAQYGVSIPVFSLFHARDNLDLYLDQSTRKFRWAPFVRDIGKLNSALLPLDYIYTPARTYLAYYLQTKGYDPLSASFISDMICIPVYLALSIPIAKYLKIIRKE